MYVVFGNEILDSKEIASLFDNNYNFSVDTDLTKSTKREDVIALKLSINVNSLHLNYSFDQYDDEIFQSYLDEAKNELEVFIKDNFDFYKRFIVEPYKWEEIDNSIYLMVAISDISLNQLKLCDVMKRLLKQND